MIHFIKGVLASKFPGFIEIDVHGVGYGLHIPISTYDRLPEAGQAVVLRTYLHVREDMMVLYGFQSDFEREMFLLLNMVSGIGPKAALSVMSVLTVSEIEDALLMGKPEVFSKVPGIGKKTAEKIIVELKDRLGKKLKGKTRSAALPKAGEEVFDHPVMEDVFLGLTQLGFASIDSRRVIDQILKDKGTIEDPSVLLKESIAMLTQKKK